MPGSLVADCLCGTLHPTETYQQGTCQPDQPAGRHNLRYIVEGSCQPIYLAWSCLFSSDM